MLRTRSALVHRVINYTTLPQYIDTYNSEATFKYFRMVGILFGLLILYIIRKILKEIVKREFLLLYSQLNVSCGLAFRPHSANDKEGTKSAKVRKAHREGTEMRFDRCPSGGGVGAFGAEQGPSAKRSEFHLYRTQFDCSM